MQVVAVGQDITQLFTLAEAVSAEAPQREHTHQITATWLPQQEHCRAQALAAQVVQVRQKNAVEADQALLSSA